ncbi:MAG: hypothetical protein EKK55_16375 [Rhodocyclaceae bacterium]|nr:MAG: hypothetical protein EKK55_16375 [Rhodocyclaceae bacterium]
MGTLHRGKREGAIPGLMAARGNCGGPFPLDKRGRPLVHGGRIEEGRVVVPGSLVLNSPRFANVRWESCPVAAVGDPSCPRPESREEWLGVAFDAANWTVDGAPLRDLIDEPTDALREAVLVIRREAAKMNSAKSK